MAYRLRSSVVLFSLVAIFLLASGHSSAQGHRKAESEKDWSAAVAAGGDNSNYAPLQQITKTNVKNLKVAWTYPTHDGGGYTFRPVIAGGRVYVLAHNNSLVALDAATGKEIWVHQKLTGIAPRGMAYWQSPDGKERRLIFAIHQQLQEIDAETGRSILTFGSQGFVDLRLGLNRPLGDIFRIQSGSPAEVYANLVIVGSSTGENYMAPPGDIRAYDVITGKLVWQFHSIPRPGDPGYDTWPKDAYKYIGGDNVWGEISVDEKRGIVYLPTSSAK